MTNREIFLQVATRHMSPDEAADQMRRDDLAARAKARPPWLPNFAWTFCMFAVALLFSAFGVRRD